MNNEQTINERTINGQTNNEQTINERTINGQTNNVQGCIIQFIIC